MKESKILEQFLLLLQSNPEKAVFGIKEVQYATDMRAIDKLLIVNSLLRSFNFEERKKIQILMNEIRDLGSEIFIFSDEHISGQKLKDITGIAAILKFPIDLD